MRILLLPLLLLPLLELIVMISIGDEIGALPVIIWIIAMIFIGVNLLRYLGASSMLKVAQSMRAGEFPAATIAEGVLKALGAVLLIVPGFITDFFALICFIPLFRRLLLKRWAGKVSMHTAGFARRHTASGDKPFNAGGNVYDHDGPARNGSQTGLLIDHEPEPSRNNPANHSKKP